jgi:hypothetical protein
MYLNQKERRFTLQLIEVSFFEVNLFQDKTKPTASVRGTRSVIFAIAARSGLIISASQFFRFLLQEMLRCWSMLPTGRETKRGQGHIAIALCAFPFQPKLNIY